MNDSKIPVRYAKALFDIAMEKNLLDPVYEDVKQVLDICSMKEVRKVMDNPVIPPSKRKEILTAIFQGNLVPLTTKFIDMVFDQGRENFLAAMARDFIDFTRKHRGIRQVTVTTAVPISDKVRTDMAALITESKKDKIEFIEHVDNSIMGGFVLRVDDSYIDASVRSRLNRFRKEFSLASKAKE